MMDKMEQINFLSALVNRIECLCKENNITVKVLLERSLLCGSVVDNMKKGAMPSIDKLIAIADHFNVSVDYLVGRTNDRMLHRREDNFGDGMKFESVVYCKDCLNHGNCTVEDVFGFCRMSDERKFCSAGKTKSDK